MNDTKNDSLTPIQFRKTKIVATLGPASNSLEMLRGLIRAGVNVFRLNFSHGNHEMHTTAISTIRQASRELKAPVAVLQDLSGPKIRISKVDGESAALLDGASVELKSASDGALSESNIIYVETLNPAQILKPKESVLLNDGSISLKAVEIGADRVICSVIKGGKIRSRVGIAFPDSTINLPATTDKDMIDLEWGIQHKVDFVALSFVQNASDIVRVREVIKSRGQDIRIISKIERKSAINQLEEILDASDGIMVARGDLGLELPIEKVPRIQKTLIEASNARGIPVIVATQMLHSMITNVRPTRAEVSDVATAVMSGADAVMLSEETTIGEHPILCVEYLHKIAIEAEQTFDFDSYKLRLRRSDQYKVPDAVAYAACAAAIKVDGEAIIACTTTGTTARLLAKYRPQQPLFGISQSIETLQRMSLYWGVMPIFIDCKDQSNAEVHTEESAAAISKLNQLGYVSSGSRVIITGGALANKPGSTSILEIRQVP
jgi:pyruvate kinase